MKYFNLWNKSKQKIDNSKVPYFYIRSGELWYTHMGQNIGFEENGKRNFRRPVLVIKKVGNLFLTVALTSKCGKHRSFYHKFTNLHLKNPKYIDSSYAILSQVKVMDKRRFITKIGSISKNEFTIVKDKLIRLLF